jgi:hypothetical protein
VKGNIVRGSRDSAGGEAGRRVPALSWEEDSEGFTSRMGWCLVGRAIENQEKGKNGKRAGWQGLPGRNRVGSRRKLNCFCKFCFSRFEFEFKCLNTNQIHFQI